MEASTAARVSLEVLDGERRVFTATGKWLHPLLELTEFLEGRSIDTGRLLLRDRIVGRAAALLIVRLGFRTVHADLVSDLALEVFKTNQVHATWDKRVHRIDCRTEELLAHVTDPQEAYRLIRERAARGPGAT